MSDTTNPKDLVGSAKAPMGALPAEAVVYGSLGIQEGAMKYGIDNFATGPIVTGKQHA